MHKGSKEIACVVGATVLIKSSGPFCAYGMQNSKRAIILGPLNANQRVLQYRLPADMDTVYVKTEKQTEWTLTWSHYSHSETLDNTPVEMPVGYEQPESLADQMRRFIKDEVSAARDADQGSFEDEDDFTDDDPLLTDYELTDMQEVEEIDWDEERQQQIAAETAKKEKETEQKLAAEKADRDEAIAAAVKKAVDADA